MLILRISCLNIVYAFLSFILIVNKRRSANVCAGERIGLDVQFSKEADREEKRRFTAWRGSQSPRGNTEGQRDPDQCSDAGTSGIWAGKLACGRNFLEP